MTTYLAALMIAILAMLALYQATTDLKQCLLIGIGILIAFEGTVVIKLWFWIMHGKTATLREIKLLQLAIAELKTCRSPEPQGTAPAFPADNVPASAPTPTAPVARKLGWRILGSVWLLAAGGLVYLAWLQSPYEPRDVTPFFEKVFGAADGVTDKEWQQSFEVTQARQHFYPRLTPRGTTARVWISVAAEGRDPMFTGQVEAGWRMSFGCPTPGRYVVKGRTERADGDFTLRIGGVDEIPGRPLFSRHFLLMLSVAVVVAIPLVWLQDRWLRQIDPELQM
jgi:hypothetical protein